MELEALGLQVRGVDNVNQAASALDKLSTSAGGAERATQGLGKGSADAAKNIDRAKNSSDGASRSIDSLASAARTAGGIFVAAFSIASLKDYADQWSDMQSQVGAATGDMAGAGDQMQRLVDIANASYAPLQQTISAYAGNVSTLQAMGRSAAEAADFTESLNHMLVLTATRGERAASVQNALSRAMATGKLQAEGLETILANGGEVANALAKELGVSTLQLRAMASEGRITGDVIANALIKNLDDVSARAAEMPATVGDAFTRVNTNFTALIGTLDQTTGASATAASGIIALADGIGDLAKNSDAVLKVLSVTAQSLAVVLGVRLAAAAGTAVISFNATGAAALNAARGVAIFEAASLRASAAMRAMGGVPGLVITAIGLAAVAWMNYGDSARKNASEGVLGLADAKSGIDELIEGFNKLGALERQNLLAVKQEDLAKATEKAKYAVHELSEAYKPFTGAGMNAIKRFNSEFRNETAALALNTQLTKDQMEQAFSDLIDGYIESGRAYESQRPQLVALASAAVSAAGDMSKLTAEMDALTDSASRANKELSDSEKLILAQTSAREALLNISARENGISKQFTDDLTAYSNALATGVISADEYAAAVTKMNAARAKALAGGGRGGNQDEGANYLKSIQERIALIGKETEYEQLLAKVRAGSIKFSTEAQKNAALAYAQTADLLREQAEFAQKASQGYQQNVDVIDNLHQSLALAALSGEALAVAQAKLSLNEYASQDQIDQVARLSAELYKLQEQQRQREQFGTGRKADQFILGNVSPLSGGAFDDQVARYEAEAEAERVRYQEQLDRLMQARELQIETNRSYDELEEEAARQHAGRLDQIDQARRSVMLATYGGAFGAMAELLKNAHGEQSSAYQAMFAVSKAFAVANATMNAYNAISAAWASAPFPANLAAVAATAPQVLAVVGAIQGTQLAGMAHDGIDSIPKEGTWLLDKGERVMTSNTSARLDGVLERIDARQRGGYSEGGAAVAEAPRVTVNLIGAPEGTQVEQRQDQDGQWVIDVMLNDLQRGGPYSRASQSAYGTTRRGT
jgi:tape measure domain-containing protein